MRLDDLDPSSNTRDHGAGGGGFMGSLIFGLLPLLFGRKLGCGTLLILAVVGYFLFSSGMLNLGGSGMAPIAKEKQGTGGNEVTENQKKH